MPPEPAGVLRRYYRALERVERSPAPALGDRVERWRMTTAAGDTVHAIWRAARPGAASPWTVVMLGGLVTGDRAALLVAPDLPVHVLAVDWPWSGRRRMTPWEIAARLGAIRRAVLRSPATLAHGVEAAFRQPEVDSSRLALLGASLGVPAAVAALRLTQAPAALILIDGGAGLATMFAAVLRREGWPGFLVPPAAALAARLVQPLEPAVHDGVGSVKRVLLINSLDDELVPRACAERLHRCFPDAEIRWRTDVHLKPQRLDRIAEIAREALVWLER
jgi:hypothetical protein